MMIISAATTLRSIMRKRPRLRTQTATHAHQTRGAYRRRHRTHARRCRQRLCHMIITAAARPMRSIIFVIVIVNITILKSNCRYASSQQVLVKYCQRLCRQRLFHMIIIAAAKPMRSIMFIIFTSCSSSSSSSSTSSSWTSHWEVIVHAISHQ